MLTEHKNKHVKNIHRYYNTTVTFRRWAVSESRFPDPRMVFGALRMLGETERRGQATGGLVKNGLGNFWPNCLATKDSLHNNVGGKLRPKCVWVKFWWQ